MELTWIAILGSLSMALAAMFVFIFAVKKDYFHNIEDTKYQVFWGDPDAPAVSKTVPKEEKRNASGQH